MSKILVVDDDKALTKAMALRLGAAGFEVHVCNDAHEASDTVVRCMPGAIVLDIDMPGYTGPEFHQCLQFTRRARHIPVIFLSGHDTEANRRIASVQGAAAFLTKPYDSDELIRTLHSVIDE